MKKIIFTLLISGVIGAVAYYAGYHSAPACDEADYKFYDTAIDENGDEVQLYVKVAQSPRVGFPASAQL